jgi:hypothetical protein
MMGGAPFSSSPWESNAWADRLESACVENAIFGDWTAPVLVHAISE